MSRITHRLFSSSSRLSAWVNLNAAARSSRATLTRRMMSSESHASHDGSTPSETPWIIGSALVFGPLFLYLVSPSARKGSHGNHGHKSNPDEHGDKHAQHVESHQDVTPIADDEGTEVSGQEVKESMEKAFETDSPKDGQEREAVVAKLETTTAEKTPATEAQSQAESLTDAIPVSESELNPTPSEPVKVDEVTHATSDERPKAPL
ncbi:hypothetical protein J3R82DRAFT_9556 [Butyriboletus roseoflavus]|nr:hypothetical protein J3R82DRAFT_9556 [Butyriboletus roseoflavus]